MGLANVNLQQGLNEVVMRKVQKMIDGKAITAHARELSPERSRELHEINGALMNRVKLPA